jgi:hypothetical protein
MLWIIPLGFYTVENEQQKGCTRKSSAHSVFCVSCVQFGECQCYESLWLHNSNQHLRHYQPLRRCEVIRDSDSLRAGRSGDWIPVGARFSAPVQTDPGAHPASCTMIFTGVKRLERGVDHLHPYSAEVKERVNYTCTQPLGLHALLTLSVPN